MNCSPHSGTDSPNKNTCRRSRRKMCALAFLLLSTGAVQAQNRTAVPTPPSDLARQNFERVAASAAQISKVIHRDAGLMVELKRWVAKDATDHGQLVSDMDLTDQAIYDRLEEDVQFRSVATALLQKYGYLLPQINPESPQGQEQGAQNRTRRPWCLALCPIWVL